MNYRMKKSVNRRGQSLLVALAAVAAPAAMAEVSLPNFFTDNMIVQQNEVLTIPGQAAPNSTVTFTADWADNVLHSAVADASGKFRLEVPTPAAGGPFTMVLSDGSGAPDKVLSNVLSGEVWLCSGQSNMEFPVKGWGQVMNVDEVVATSHHPEIRLLQVKKNIAFGPKEDAEINMGGWREASPATMDFSAIAYLFALDMQKQLGVPVGVIDATWGGTPAETWVSYEALQNVPGFEKQLNQLKQAEFSDEKMKAAYQAELQKYLEGVRKLDVDFDRAAMQSGEEWGKMPVPQLWEETVLPGFDGMVWMQRELTLPAEAAGKPLKLSLGKVDNMDDTYFNGVRVGGFDNYGADRVYEVPASAVKGGSNVISVRVIDFDGGGGIYGEPEQLYAEVDGKSYPLSGSWNYRAVADLKSLPGKPANPYTSQYPTLLYNAMIHPVSVMPVRGVLWYQGCANVGRAGQYVPLFKSLISDWRTLYNRPELPFYFVQLAGFLQPQPVQPASEWAALRNSQARALELPNTGMAVAIDLGNPIDIHPTNKQEVARRLGLLALNRTYGKKGIVDEAPVVKSVNIKGNKMVLTFSEPVHSISGTATGFIIGDVKGKFAYGNARFVNDHTIEVSSPLIAKPTAVRYNWADYPGGSLYGATDLPVAPFATDL